MSLVFFTDRDLGKQFPEILRSAGLTVERHRDHFDHNTEDETWLQAVGQLCWIAGRRGIVPGNTNGLFPRAAA